MGAGGVRVVGLVTAGNTGGWVGELWNMMVRALVAVVGFAAVIGLVLATTDGRGPPPRPVSPFPATVTIAAIHTPADLVLADGRRLHVPRLQGSPASTACHADADMTLARALLSGGVFSMTAPRVTDTPGAVPAGSLQGDLAGAGGVDYGDTFYDRQWTYRAQHCPPPMPAPAPSSTYEPSEPGGDTVIVHGGGDDHHESRFCRRRAWC